MKYFLYFSPNGEVLDTQDEIDEDFNLRDIIYHSLFSDFDEYWFDCSSTAELAYMKNDKLISHLSISADSLGISLHYTNSTGENILSVSNIKELNRTISTMDDVRISTGLFISIEDAWEAIDFFLNTGNASLKINWIPAKDIPENGSYA
ncbi:MAG: hypothetical protein K2O42_08085 [Oscillospiraceae bacterium]|nr:hypothetical protein [Oscillospiraceae bacterium]